MLERNRIIEIARDELVKHSLDTFVDDPPSIAKGGRGVVVTGCPGCRKQFQSVNQFVNHLVDDVLPVIADRVVNEEA
jgi:Fe-S oxidoreductase